MTPAVDRLSPVGSEPDDTDQPVGEMVAPPAEPDVVADIETGEIAVPEFLVNGPGLVTVTALLTVQVKPAVLAVAAWVSVAVTVTEEGVALPVVGVPEMTPVEELMDKPGGRPLAE